MKEISVGIFWVPFDHGVKLVGGRVGARFGPEKIKKEFSKLIKTNHLKRVRIIDFGKVVPAGNDVKKTHERVTKALIKILKRNVIPIVIGGGHDISFGSGKAMYLTCKKFGQINIDAHYDVRPVVNGIITSGTPFRRLLDGRFLNGKNFIEFGAHSPRCLPEHYQYLMKKKATVMKLDSINKLGIEAALKKAFLIAKKGTNAVVFDIDIDGIQQRFAPGCSAPGIRGFTKTQALKSAFLAGRNKDVKLFNIMEVNPLYDVKNKTVRLAAELIIEFVHGLNERE